MASQNKNKNNVNPIISQDRIEIKISKWFLSESTQFFFNLKKK